MRGGGATKGVPGADLGFGLDGAPLNLRSCAFLESMGTIATGPYWSIFGAKRASPGLVCSIFAHVNIQPELLTAMYILD